MILPRRHPICIAVVSCCVLILELAFIRQVPAEVQAISYFTNLMLMASFFGLGIGCVLHCRRTLFSFFPLGLLMTCAYILVARGIVVYDASREVHFWIHEVAELGVARSFPLFPSALVAFAVSALPFVAMGQELARRMDDHPRLIAYGWDIVGSLAGIVVFSAASFAEIPPWIWPPIIAVCWAVLFVREIKWRLLCVCAGCAFFSLAYSHYDTRWSPYYYVQWDAQDRGLCVWVNSSFHQLALDFGEDGESPPGVPEDMMARFSIPYHAYEKLHEGRSPASVLVLGAGTGNDVFVALHNGAENVSAVEIDPAILRLGVETRPASPYSDSRVQAKIDDARHFLRSTEESFDLIIFGTLDSQTLLSGVANLRLENYVYTAEALEAARRRLKEGGMVAVNYSVMKPWLYGRIYSTVRSVFGDQVRMTRTESHFLFNTVITACPDFPEYVDDPDTVADFSGARVNTDDWPYLYLESPTIAPIYRKLFGIMAVLLAVMLIVARRTRDRQGSGAPFFLLGMGFMLMESAAIVRLSLAFGSTWVVNAVVFFAVLSTIFLANYSVQKGWGPTLRAGWVCVIIGVLVNWAFPVQILNGFGFPVRVILSILLIGTPVFFAAACFSRLFEKEESTGYPLGMNLVGVMCGGFFEYVSMLTGMRAVWLLVVVVYFSACFAAMRTKQKVVG